MTNLFMEMALVFLGLHCIADFPLQGDFLATHKATNKFIMSVHCTMWTFIVFLGLKYYGIYQWFHIPFLWITHFMIDSLTCSLRGNGKELTSNLIIDQILHLITLGACLFTGIVTLIGGY